jgi:hypothetical protein
MANRALDFTPPGILVLLTGDGSGYTDGKGFIRQLEQAHKHGWQIELVSWDAGCNRFLRQRAEEHGLLSLPITSSAAEKPAGRDKERISVAPCPNQEP